MTTVAAETSPPLAFRGVWLIAADHMMTHWYPATFYLLLLVASNAATRALRRSSVLNLPQNLLSGDSSA
jgi:hypothetical protein